MEAAMTETDAIALLEQGLPTTTVCAEELHKFLLATHKLEGRIKRLSLEALLRMKEGDLYSLLGYADIFVYSKIHFNYGSTATSDALRAAKALRSLPRTTEAMDSHRVAYSRVLEITKVATSSPSDPAPRRKRHGSILPGRRPSPSSSRRSGTPRRRVETIPGRMATGFRQSR
jgi:hypothetical protein